MGLIARSADDLPLSIGQTGLRWVGTMLTLALIGLPAILLFTGASLTDWMSGSRTFDGASKPPNPSTGLQ